MTADDCGTILFSLKLNSATHVARHVAWTRRGQKESPAIKGKQIATQRDMKPHKTSESYAANY